MVEYFHLILSEGHIEMDLIKVAHVHDWLTPRNVTKVQSFVDSLISTGVSSETSHMWPSPYNCSLRQEKHGDGRRMNRRPSKNSSSSSPNSAFTTQAFIQHFPNLSLWSQYLFLSSQLFEVKIIFNHQYLLKVPSGPSIGPSTRSNSGFSPVPLRPWDFSNSSRA